MVGLFDSPDYNEIALNALQQLVLMTATHMPEKRFSYLGELMSIGRDGQRRPYFIFCSSFFAEQCLSVNFELVKRNLIVVVLPGKNAGVRCTSTSNDRSLLPLPSLGKYFPDDNGRAEN